MRYIQTRGQFASILNPGKWAVVGVGEGLFADSLLQSSTHPTVVYAIDDWANNEKQWRRAEKRLDLYGGRSIILKCEQAKAIKQFEDGFFDFIYIDTEPTDKNKIGVLDAWWPKLKADGVFAGHDYHLAWQPTIEAVNQFCVNHGLMPKLTNIDAYPSWWVVK